MNKAIFKFEILFSIGLFIGFLAFANSMVKEQTEIEQLQAQLRPMVLAQATYRVD